MKWIKLLTIVAVALFFFGCGGPRYQNWMQHGSHFKNGDHMAFSLFGWKAPTPEDSKETKEQGWWGVEIK